MLKSKKLISRCVALYLIIYPCTVSWCDPILENNMFSLITPLSEWIAIEKNKTFVALIKLISFLILGGKIKIRGAT